MQQLIPTLFAHELHALRAALHRDECRELKRAATDPRWADWHKQNARLSRRLLVLVESIGESECTTVSTASDDAAVTDDSSSRTNDRYLAAVAEFDALWERDSRGLAEARMQELLAVIAPFEDSLKRTAEE